uniref:Uncharacterized protein n=1 Tax=Arundo donax TaxID=35708 RepID=A0A0A9F5Y8_ARUDO
MVHFINKQRYKRGRGT